MSHRRCGGFVVVFLLACVSFVNAQDGMPKTQPDDLTVAAYELAKDQIKTAVEREAKTRKAFLDQAKVIDQLAIPWKMNGQVSIRVMRRQRYEVKKGRLSELTGRNVYLGSTSYAMASIHPDDRDRLKYVGKPDLLKQFIAKARKDLKTRIDAWIRNEISSRIEAQGYTAKFFERTIIMAGAFWFREDLGDKGRVRVSITEFDKSCGHMSQFVDVKMTYAGKEKFSAVLHVGGKPIAAIGGNLDGKILDLKWHSVNYRVPRESIFGNSKATKVLRKGVTLNCMKRHVGQWELKGKPAGSKSANVVKVLCPECWGKKESMPPPAVNIRKDVEARMKGMQATESVKLELELLIAKYGKEVRKGRTVPCTFCDGSGHVELENGVGKTRRYDLVFNLGVKKPEDFTEAAAKKQAKDFAAVDKCVKKVAELEKGETKKIANKRLEARRKKAIEELDKLIGVHKVAVAEKMYKELEKINWLEPDQLPNGDVGTGRVDLKDSGKRGNKPKKLFNLDVRRMTPWQRIPSFRGIGRMPRVDYAITSCHFRLIEIGGKPIVKEDPGAEKDVPPPDRETPASTRRRPTRRRVDDEQQYGRRRTPARRTTTTAPEETPEGLRRETVPQEGIEDVKVEIPDDLLDRRYVIQYAARISTGRRFRQFLTTTKFTVVFTSNRSFPLEDKEKTLNLSFTYKIGELWDGDMLGASLISLNQLLADITGKNAVSFDADVKRK